MYNSWKRNTDGKQHMQRCSHQSQGIKEMKIKTRIGYYYAHLRMAKIMKIMTTPNTGKNAENLITHTLLVKTIQPIWQFLVQLSIQLLYDTSTAPLGIYPRKIKVFIHTKICTKMSVVALLVIAKNWSQSRCPLTSEWLNKLWYTHHGILLSNKKE